jgi:hypothetical protein
MGGAIFLPEQHAGDATPAQLLLDINPVGDRALIGLRWGWRREQQELERLVIEPVRQRSAQPCQTGAAQIAMNDAIADPQRARDDAFGQALLVS